MWNHTITFHLSKPKTTITRPTLRRLSSKLNTGPYWLWILSSTKCFNLRKGPIKILTFNCLPVLPLYKTSLPYFSNPNPSRTFSTLSRLKSTKEFITKSPRWTHAFQEQFQSSEQSYGKGRSSSNRNDTILCIRHILLPINHPYGTLHRREQIIT